MTRQTYPQIGFEERMSTVEFRVGSRPHIVLNPDSCSGCSTQACVSACPANLFVVTSDGGIVFNYEQCFECGTCYLVCDTEGALTWTYPDGGYGVVFARG
jgi:ferredoxin like protein